MASKYEQETVISFNAADNTADIYTADPAWMNKLDKLVEKNPEQFGVVETRKQGSRIVSKRYSLPKRFLTIRSKDVKRELTEKQKTELAERLKQARKAM